MFCLPAANDFLIGLIAGKDLSARAAPSALAIHRDHPKITASIAAAVEANGAEFGAGLIREETPGAIITPSGRKSNGSSARPPTASPMVMRSPADWERTASSTMRLALASSGPRLSAGIAGPGAGCYHRIMSEVTQILQALAQGDRQSAEQLLPLVYDELRKLAAHKLAQNAPGQTLQATALVHEAYLRVVPRDAAAESAKLQWDSRGHFFAAAAEAMRRILLDRARDKHRVKRGGGRKRMQLDHIDVSVENPPDDLLVLDEALQKLVQEEPVCAELFKLRFFAGLSVSEAASSLGIPRRTAYRHWAFARAWLYEQLRQSPQD
jgi:RNA polymerase sigma factor (TIGR02999 family)